MLKSEITRGTQYALREKRVAGVPLQRVRILEHVRGNKWKAEWVEPNPGLVDFVESAQLIVPWREHRAFLRDEVATARLREHNEKVGYEKGSPIADALMDVFESTGEQVQLDQGTLHGRPDAMDRIRARAKAVAGTSLVAFVDRHGELQAPFDEALDLGRKFCAAEPATVLTGIEATERKWAAEAGRAGGDYLVGLLNESRPAWALIRQWAGHDSALAQRDERIQRLERLVWDAVYALQKASLNDEAARLRRAIERG